MVSRFLPIGPQTTEYGTLTFTLHCSIHKLPRMAAEYDTTEFIDTEFQTNKSSYNAVASTFAPIGQRAPSREEVDSKVAEAQQKLAELKRAQEELERERAALEETRRRHMELQNGRQEMMQNLVRGVSILEEAEFTARQDAEQMAKSLGELREALAKVQAIQEDSWTKSDFHVELTRALTSIENARMEWNAARLKFPVLSGEAASASAGQPIGKGSANTVLPEKFTELCRFGLAMTWPLAVIGLAALGLLAFALLRH